MHTPVLTPESLRTMDTLTLIDLFVEHRRGWLEHAIHRELFSRYTDVVAQSTLTAMGYTCNWPRLGGAIPRSECSQNPLRVDLFNARLYRNPKLGW